MDFFSKRQSSIWPEIIKISFSQSLSKVFHGSQARTLSFQLRQADRGRGIYEEGSPQSGKREKPGLQITDLF